MCRARAEEARHKLRNFKLSMKQRVLSDRNVIGGKGRLTDAEIDNLQIYYGLAIRRNLKDVVSMQNAVWATYLHKMSTDDTTYGQKGKAHGVNIPPHIYYTHGVSKASKTPYKHTKSLPMAVMIEIEPIYEDLTQEKFLEQCLHGKTQNESLNNCKWRRVPNTDFVILNTLKLGVMDAVICFNEGCIAKVNGIQRLGITPGKFMDFQNKKRNQRTE